MIEFTKASPASRLFAIIIDFIVAYVPMLILGFVLGFIGVQLGSLIAFGYALTKDALPYFNGQSIGKKTMRIRVVNAETGAPITNDYGAAAIRMISLMIPFFNIIDCLMVLIDAEGKRFGDKWAKTIVIEEK